MESEPSTDERCDPPAGSELIAVWRRPAKRGPSTPLIIFLHGTGADENDLLELADAFPRSFTAVSLRGPIALTGGGFVWYESRGVGLPVAKSLRAAVGMVRSWLETVTAREAFGGVYLLGFSAGMMMAGALVLDDPARFAGAVLLSGALPLASGIPALPGRLAGLPIFAARGLLDDIIPATLVAQTDTYLRVASGAALTERIYRHAHAISAREIDDIATWLRDRA